MKERKVTSKRMISLVTGTMSVAVLLPVVLSIWLARYQAEQRFHQDLSAYSQRINTLASQVIDEAKAALKEINRVDSQTCDRDHLQAMRRVAFTYRYIQEVVFLKGSQALCSSLEQESHIAPFPEPEKISNAGYRIWFTPTNDQGIDHYMIAMSHSDHMVVVDPRSFIDVIPFGPWPIEAALVGLTHDRVITSSAPLSPKVWQAVRARNLSQYREGENVYSIFRNRQGNFAVVVWASSHPMNVASRQQLMVWLPVGILLSLLLAALVLRLMKERHSPRFRLMNAIKSRQLTVCYQPIIRLTDRKCVGVEALVRWPQADGSQLTPDIFIPLAEQTGLINALTRLVIENVFSEMGNWLHQQPDFHVSVNLAPGDLHNNDILQLLTEYGQRHQIRPQQIAIEITERGFADPTVTGPVIKQFRAAGHPVYIDDFGTGYSSLSYLQNLDVDVLKIDKAFVDALEYNTVAPHIIDMAKHLHLEMVAEGIETVKQAEWLASHGVQYGQGWLFSKALNAAELRAWCDNNA